jgi:hypothetical protein
MVVVFGLEGAFGRDVGDVLEDMGVVEILGRGLCHLYEISS